MSFSDGHIPSGAEYLLNLDEKMGNRLFTGDMAGLLRPGFEYNLSEAYVTVKDTFITLMK
jgi:hypothetical protein